MSKTIAFTAPAVVWQCQYGLLGRIWRHTSVTEPQLACGYLHVTEPWGAVTRLPEDTEVTRVEDVPQPAYRKGQYGSDSTGRVEIRGLARYENEWVYDVNEIGLYCYPKDGHLVRESAFRPDAP